MEHNWSAVREQATRYLQDLVRIDTTNPPGNETRAAEYLAGVLKREGIESTILESVPGRGNLVARLKGDGRAAPLLLMVHLDVVPAEADKWTHPPFGAEIADGFLWGRGTLDTKELAAMELMALLLLKRANKTLGRDVIFMANADEEAGGRMGAGWMVKEHPDLIRSEYALNEGGGFAIDMLGQRFFTCQVAEKGTARFVMRTRGRPGHGSQPHRDNSVLKLADAISKIGAAELPYHATATVKLFLEAIASNVGKPHDKQVLELLDANKYRSAVRRLPLDEGLRSMLYAMFHNTVTPTMLSAGTKVNVIPSYAEAKCDARLLPGQTSQSLLHELRLVIGNDVEVEFLDDTPALESDPQSPLYDTIARVMARHAPQAPLLPYLVVGATDARHVRKLGTRVYGFSPMLAPTSELDRVHGHDERISLDNLEFGTRVLYELVSEFCEKP
jgi:acetylornithine deacetylase/succinyl-diaminopimelate desuccinylase-like protein